VKASHTLDSVRTSFDEEHLVANAGLLLPATLMQRLGCATSSMSTSTSMVFLERPTWG
jgi:hypothetical protein